VSFVNSLVILMLATLLSLAANADTTDLCGVHNAAVPKACRQACEVANEIRASKNLPLMEVDPAVCQAAKTQAQFLFKKFGACNKAKKKECLSHSGQGVSDASAALTKRLQAAGAGFNLATENINIGYVDLDGAFNRGWMRSKVHRANLLDRRFRRQGYARVGEYRVHVLTD